jgi:hypothetical protein
MKKNKGGRPPKKKFIHTPTCTCFRCKPKTCQSMPKQCAEQCVTSGHTKMSDRDAKTIAKAKIADIAENNLKGRREVEQQRLRDNWNKNSDRYNKSRRDVACSMVRSHKCLITPITGGSGASREGGGIMNPASPPLSH